VSTAFQSTQTRQLVVVHISTTLPSGFTSYHTALTLVADLLRRHSFNHKARKRKMKEYELSYLHFQVGLPSPSCGRVSCGRTSIHPRRPYLGVQRRPDSALSFCRRCFGPPTTIQITSRDIALCLTATAKMQVKVSLYIWLCPRPIECEALIQAERRMQLKGSGSYVFGTVKCRSSNTSKRKKLQEQDAYKV
jgi:hypothetical protein